MVSNGFKKWLSPSCTVASVQSQATAQKDPTNFAADTFMLKLNECIDEKVQVGMPLVFKCKMREATEQAQLVVREMLITYGKNSGEILEKGHRVEVPDLSFTGWATLVGNSPSGFEGMRKFSKLDNIDGSIAEEILFIGVPTYLRTYLPTYLPSSWPSGLSSKGLAPKSTTA